MPQTSNNYPIIDPEVKSFLLSISPLQLGVLSSIIGILIAGELTFNEQNVVGNFLQGVGQVMEVISAQGSFIETVEQKIEDKEKPDLMAEIKNLQAKLKDMENRLNKQIKME